MSLVPRGSRVMNIFTICLRTDRHTERQTHTVIIVDTSCNLFLQVPSIETYAIDLTEWDATRSLLESLGHVDLLVNNAGVITIAPFLDFKKEDMDK